MQSRTIKGIIAISIIIAMTAIPVAFAGKEKKTTLAMETDTVALIVNGHPIMESEIEKTLRAGLGNKVAPPDTVEKMLAQYRNEILEALVSDYLLDEKAEKAGITVDEEELQNIVSSDMDKFLSANKMDKKEMEKRIFDSTGMTIEQFVEARSKNPMLKKQIIRERLITSIYPKALDVSNKEMQAFYDNNMDKFQKPEMVRASHILIGAGQDASKKEKAKALEKAGKILEEVKKPGADFEIIARENSTGPSASKGGDLGFFRKEAMVPSFADAAFALEPGQTSQVVTTMFGYHIIKVTEKKKAELIAYDSVKGKIKENLRAKKFMGKEKILAKELREKAKVETPVKAKSA